MKNNQTQNPFAIFGTPNKVIVNGINEPDGEIAERDKNITKLRESIDDFAEYCEKRNTELKGELHDLLLVAGISVLDGVVDSVNFKFGRLKVNISTNSKGNIVIGFTYSDGAKVEV